MGQSRLFEESLEVVAAPKQSDILCGKNKECLDHPGSKAFRDVIEQFVTRYKQADSKYMKMEITKEIYEHLSEQSSRFLKYNSESGMWQELTSSAVRDKIGHALRFANRRKRRRKSNQASASGAMHRRSNSDTSAYSSGYESSSSSAHSVGSLEPTELSGPHDEFRPVTKILQMLNVSLPQAEEPISVVSPYMTQSKPEKQLTDGEVFSIMNAPLIEFEPQTIHHIYEL